MKVKKVVLAGTCCSLLFLAACFQGEQSSLEIDPPENAEAVNEDKETGHEVTQEDSGSIEGLETVARQLYLIDANGMVASQTLDLPLLESQEVATQVLEYLIVDGPITEVLPNGFRAVLPAGTEILGLNLQEDGTMIVDFSEEFKEYQAADEVKIVEAITHTLTQFDSVEQVQLWINGHPLHEMPVNGTAIGKSYSRANGINIVNPDGTDMMHSEAVTMYYPAAYEGNRYYIPVTQYVETKDNNRYQSIISSLINGPGYDSNVVHVFNSGTSLMNEPVLRDGVLELIFNDAILTDNENAVIADEVVETIVRTLSMHDQIEAVDIKVDNKEQLKNENGEAYSQPVSTEIFDRSEAL
ncbi:GerMN domain-containing protein [Oceanobacillus sp. CAU 1775]